MDDFRPEDIPWHKFLKLLDRYAYKVETKGGSRQFVARCIYITAPYAPETIFLSQGEDVQQLVRRLREVREFTEVYDGSDVDEYDDTWYL